MKGQRLTYLQRQQLRDQMRSATDVRVYKRALALLLDEGPRQPKWPRGWARAAPAIWGGSNDCASSTSGRLCTSALGAAAPACGPALC